MYASEVFPAFPGATYSDELQMIDADTGAVQFFLPTDGLTWRLLPVGRQLGFAPGYGWGCGWDYGFPVDQSAFLDCASLMTLTNGAGVTVTTAGTALWWVPQWPLWLRRSEYRMTLDLLRYGETVRVMDTILPVQV